MAKEETVRVKMRVQTMYHAELLRAGKEYNVPEETAKRWIIRGLAEVSAEKAFSIEVLLLAYFYKEAPLYLSACSFVAEKSQCLLYLIRQQSNYYHRIFRKTLKNPSPFLCNVERGYFIVRFTIDQQKILQLSLNKPLLPAQDHILQQLHPLGKPQHMQHSQYKCLDLYKTGLFLLQYNQQDRLSHILLTSPLDKDRE